MRAILYTLALCLIVLPGAYAQMDQDQAQATQTSTYNVTVQQGCPVRVGGPASADVLVNGLLAIRVPAAAGGMTAMERGQAIADRLNQAFAAGLNWNDTRVGQVGDNWVVAMGNRVIATADSRSADVYRTSEGQLASRWAQQTVVAMGGQPTTIAAQLRPVPTQVAGAQQEMGTQPGTTGAGAVNWAVTPWKTVPLINSSTGANMGMITVGGRQSQIDMVNSVVAYQSTNDSATVWTFVPIQGTSATGTLTRVNGVGVVGIPSGLLPMANVMTGTNVMNMVTQNASQWNSMINAALSQNNVRLTGTTKVVPLYDLSTNQVVGAAQVVGDATAVAQTQSVALSVSGDDLRFNATPTAASSISGQPATLNNVVVSSIILMSGMSQPGTPGAGMQTTPDNEMENEADEGTEGAAPEENEDGMGTTP